MVNARLVDLHGFCLPKADRQSDIQTVRRTDIHTDRQTDKKQAIIMIQIVYNRGSHSAQLQYIHNVRLRWSQSRFKIYTMHLKYLLRMMNYSKSQLSNSF